MQQKKTWKNHTRMSSYEYSKRYRIKILSQGLCIKCRKKRENEKSHSCNSCIVKIRNYRHEREKKRINTDLCKWCGLRKKIKNRMCCYECVLKYQSQKAFKSTKLFKDLKKIYDNQNGKCVYTGIKMRIGKDATIDHIIPKYKGGKNELQNIQWVLKDINDMKRTLLHNDFIKYCKLIANRF